MSDPKHACSNDSLLIRFRVDRIRGNGQVDEWFYPHEFRSRAEANAFVRGRKYRGTVKVVRFKCRPSVPGFKVHL